MLDDHSAYAQRRQRRLRRACEEERIELHVHPGTTIVPPGAVTPTGGDHFKVFTPYHRAWSELPLRERAPAPRRLSVPSGVAAGRLPALAKLTGGSPSPQRAAGGEREARRLMRAFLRGGLGEYEARHDDLPATRRRGSAPTCASAASRRWS